MILPLLTLALLITLTGWLAAIAWARREARLTRLSITRVDAERDCREANGTPGLGAKVDVRA